MAAEVHRVRALNLAREEIRAPSRARPSLGAVAITPKGLKTYKALVA